MNARLPEPTPPGEKGLRRLARIAIPREADLILLGDSNAAAWPGDLLESALSGWHVFNFGLPSDRIQNTLWRLGTIGTSHLRPRVVLVILGTNNLADGDAPEAIADGLVSLARRISDLWDRPRVILPAIARRRAGPLARAGERAALNALLLALAEPRVEVVRSDLVLDEAGPAAFEEDGIHISREGYARLTEALALRLLDG